MSTYQVIIELDNEALRNYADVRFVVEDRLQGFGVTIRKINLEEQ